MSDFDVLEYMDTFGMDSKNGFGKYCCKTDIFDSDGRGNRFPSGRTRVPVCKIEKNDIFELRNRLLLERNRVPR